MMLVPLAIQLEALFSKNTLSEVILFINTPTTGASRMFQSYHSDESTNPSLLYLRVLPYHFNDIKNTSISSLVIASISFNEKLQSRGYFNLLISFLESISQHHLIVVENAHANPPTNLPAILRHKGFTNLENTRHWFRSVIRPQSD